MTVRLTTICDTMAMMDAQHQMLELGALHARVRSVDRIGNPISEAVAVARHLAMHAEAAARNVDAARPHFAEILRARVAANEAHFFCAER